jgi:DNA polymerase-3 subunit epsilon
MTKKASASLDKNGLVRGLPDSPGVYLFFGPAGELLYVGKSKNLRTRVRSHFASTDEVRMCSQVCHIEARQTPGELGALLLESQLIKELRPIYNIRSRQSRRIIIARRVGRSDGYAGLVLEAVRQIDPENTAPIMSIFKHKTQAKEFLSVIAREHRLCPKLLGLERTHRHCFSYHLGHCDGACMGCEPRDAYNKRFEEAFAQRRLKAWPYSGAVIIEEKGKGGEEAEVFVVDQWCLLYSFRYSLDKCEVRVRGSHLFDYDSYKILCKYLLEEEHEETMRTLTREGLHRILGGVTPGASAGASLERIGAALRNDLARMVKVSPRVPRNAEQQKG